MNWVKQYLIVCTLVCTLLSASSHAAHMYYIGVLSSFSNNQMIVDGKQYPISPKAKVILRVVGSNRAIHEKSGRISDISVGNNITIKVSNGEITEIEKVISR